MVEIIWTEPALTSLERIHDYVADQAPHAAEALVRRLQAAVLRLEQFPLSGRAVPEFPGSPYRKVIESGYRIIYRLADE